MKTWLRRNLFTNRVLFGVLGFCAFLVLWGEILRDMPQSSLFERISKHSVVVLDVSSPRAKEFVSYAKNQIGTVTSYDHSNGYYAGQDGYPPPDTGVCSDVIARAFDQMGSGTLRMKVDEDMKRHPELYPNTFDTYINFRRVKNLKVFFERTAQSLPTDLLPRITENLALWQAGDIVIFASSPATKLYHIGIIADARREDGVPYMIDNHGYGTSIRITPLDWPGPIVGHYRVF